MGTPGQKPILLMALGRFLLIYASAAPIDLVSRFDADRTARKQMAQIDVVS
jgi:hypothetical protein